jgi:hypothetical protein
MWRLAMYGLVGLALLVSALFAVARLSGPNEAQREALALMEMPPAPAGRNAFAATWLLGYPLPEAELEAVLAQDLQAFPAFQRTEAARRFESYESVAAQKLPMSVLDEADHRVLCGMIRDIGCVQKILADPAPQIALVARHAALIERFRRLRQYTYSRSPFPPDEMMSASPRMIDVAALARTQDVLALADGNPTRALEGLCGTITTGRRLLTHASTLLDGGIQLAVLHGLARDTGEVLARLPRDAPIPRACYVAFAPPTVPELSTCNGVRGEFLNQRAMIMKAHQSGELTGDLPGLLGPVMFDREKAISSVALDLAPSCTSKALDALRADRPAPEYVRPPRSLLYCVGHFRGCSLEDMGTLSVEAWQRRQLDHGARMRMLGAALYFRSRPESDAPLQAQLAALPAALRSRERPFEVASGRVRVPMYWTPEQLYVERVFELPSAAFLGSDAR